MGGLVLIIATMLTLSSCGGGGGGSSTSSGNPTYTLSGTVSGPVLQGVTITLSGAGAGTTTTNADGTYSFTGLSNGYYTVTASRVNYAFSPSSQVVAVNYANAAAVDFVSNNAYSISGTILESVTGIQGVTVNLSGSTLSAPVSTTTDTNGNYTFSGLVTNGTYTITPSKTWQSCVCGSLLGGCGLTVTEGYRFTPVSLSITISGTDAAGENFTGAFSPWRGACPN